MTDVDVLERIEGRLAVIQRAVLASDLARFTELLTVDAIDKTVVNAMMDNPGWTLLATGTGAGGQTTLTFGWGEP